MTDEERQRQMDFILNQQAQLTAVVGQLSEKVGRIAESVGALADRTDALTTKLDRTTDALTTKIDRTADGIASLLAIAEIHDREITATNEKLGALISTVERYISEGRNGKG